MVWTSIPLKKLQKCFWIQDFKTKDTIMDNDKKSLDSYLSEIGTKQQLSDKQESELAQRIKGGDEKAVSELMSHNLKYVISVASQYKKRGLDMEDLISEGNIGMLKAARKYDGSKRFVTFAAPYIRDAIEKAIEQQSGLYRVPRDVADAALEKKRSRALSIDAPVGGSPELSLGRVIPDTESPDPEKELQKDILVKELKSLVYTLPSREQHVLQRFYGIGVDSLTMAEIGQEMGLKRERVRQIRDHAVRQILKKTHNANLKDYLKN